MINIIKRLLVGALILLIGCVGFCILIWLLTIYAHVLEIIFIVIMLLGICYYIGWALMEGES